MNGAVILPTKTNNSAWFLLKKVASRSYRSCPHRYYIRKEFPPPEDITFMYYTQIAYQSLFYPFSFLLKSDNMHSLRKLQIYELRSLYCPFCHMIPYALVRAYNNDIRHLKSPPIIPQPHSTPPRPRRSRYPYRYR